MIPTQLIDCYNSLKRWTRYPQIPCLFLFFLATRPLGDQQRGRKRYGQLIDCYNSKKTLEMIPTQLIDCYNSLKRWTRHPDDETHCFHLNS